MSKYNNKKVVYEGITFDSEMECEYYKYLLTQYDKNDIVLQPRFLLQTGFIKDGIKKILPIVYVADFMIKHKIVVDVKGFETADFTLKKKMFWFNFPNFDLMIITKAPKWTGENWIEVDRLKKMRKNKKEGK